MLVFLIGVTIGVYQAVRQHSFADGALSVVSLFFYSMPSFWFGIILLIVFWSYLGWFPSGRMDPAIWNTISHPTNFYVIDALIATDLT